MTYRTIVRFLVPCALLAVLALPARGMHEEEGDPTDQLLGAAPSGETDDETEESDGERRVERHRIVFVGEDGTVEEIEGEDEAFGWLAVGSPQRRMSVRLPSLSLREGGFLGVATTSLTPELRHHFGAPEGAGVMISQVVDDSPAFAAGLRVGDILTAVDGEPIHREIDLLQQIRRRDEGDSVSLDLVRDGRAEQVVAVLDRTTTPGPRPLSWSYSFGCEDEADCGELDFDPIDLGLCGDGSRCEVRVECEGGACRCEVDGESVECRDLQLPHSDDD